MPRFFSSPLFSEYFFFLWANSSAHSWNLTIHFKLHFADIREAIGVSKDGLGDDKIGMSDRCIIIYHNSKNDDDSQSKIYYNNIRMILL